MLEEDKKKEAFSHAATTASRACAVYPLMFVSLQWRIWDSGKGRRMCEWPIVLIIGRTITNIALSQSFQLPASWLLNKQRFIYIFFIS